MHAGSSDRRALKSEIEEIKQRLLDKLHLDPLHTADPVGRDLGWP